MIPLESTDKREFDLSYTVGFPYGDIIIRLNQLDILRIIKALKRINNQQIAQKLIKFIEKIDYKEDENTNFNRIIPRRGLK